MSAGRTPGEAARAGRAALDRWIFREYREANGAPGTYRVLFGTAVLMMVVPGYVWMAGLPDTFFAPGPSPAYLFRGLPPAWVFYALDTLLVGCCLLLVTGRHVKVASVAMTLVFLVGNTWKYSLGKIDHDILLVLTPLLLASYWSPSEEDRPRTGWPLALLALAVALSMAAGGGIKAWTGWLEPGAQAVRSKVVPYHVRPDTVTPLSGLLLPLDASALWELADVWTVALEASFLVAMWRLRNMRLACAAACLFHLGVFLLMGIPFAANVLVYGAFVDWGPVEARLRARPRVEKVRGWIRERGLAVPVAGTGVVSVLFLVGGNPAVLLAERLWGYEQPIHLLILALSVPVAATYILRRVVAFRS